MVKKLAMQTLTNPITGSTALQTYRNITIITKRLSYISVIMISVIRKYILLQII